MLVTVAPTQSAAAASGAALEFGVKARAVSLGPASQNKQSMQTAMNKVNTTMSANPNPLPNPNPTPNPNPNPNLNPNQGQHDHERARRARGRLDATQGADAQEQVRGR